MKIPVPKVRDFELLTLVEHHDVSVRLRNSIFTAADTDTLPIKTVGAYFDASDDAQPIMMSNIRNFGCKTARELDDLVYAVIAAETDAPPVSRESTTKLRRSELLAIFGEVTLAEAVRGELFSTRLGNALTEATLTSMRFADLIENFQASIAMMLRVPNCGRKSVIEFRKFCEGYISSKLHQTGYAETMPLVLWLLGGEEPAHSIAVTKSDFSEGSSNELDSSSLNPLTVPKHESLLDRLEWLLGELEKRSELIIRRRNGIGQESCETLEEIGRDESVTRERIRQIEVKSLKRIRIRVQRAPIVELLALEGSRAWVGLAPGEAWLRRDELHDRRHSLDPYVRLALHIEGLSLDAWLDQVTRPMRHGWLSPNADAAAVETAGELLAAATSAPLPQPLKLLTSSDAVPAARAAAILIHDQPVRYDYLMPSRVGVRLTRLVRLHILLAHEKPYYIDLLVQRYRAIFEDDYCSERDAEIVMDAAPHLFLEIEEGCWTAIGSAGASLPDSFTSKSPRPTRAEEFGTIAEALQTTLHRRGPARLVDLIDNAQEILPDGRSANSIGPILLTRRELFVRVLPGVYALPDQVKSYMNNMPKEWPVLFNDTQAKHYAISRYAGEPRHIFPFWSQETEYQICRWARHSGGDAILASLLAIATINEWPVNEDERQDWLRLQQLEGRYGLGSSLRLGAAYERPELDRVFAACRYAVRVGEFNWVAGNRLTGRGIGWHGGAGLVALLIRLGVIEEIDREGYRWQRPHRTTSIASELCDRLDAAFGRLGADANWKSAIGLELAEYAITQIGNDWVDNTALAEMLSGSYAQEDIDVDEEDPLAQLLAMQRRARDVKRREATLDWLLEE